jgi:hypothetical protein
MLLFFLLSVILAVSIFVLLNDVEIVSIIYKIPYKKVEEVVDKKKAGYNLSSDFERDVENKLDGVKIFAVLFSMLSTITILLTN